MNLSEKRKELEDVIKKINGELSEGAENMARLNNMLQQNLGALQMLTELECAPAPVTE